MLAWISENTQVGITVTLHGFLVADPDDNVYTDKQSLAIDVAAYNPVLWIVSTQADPKTMLYASETYAEDNYELTLETAERINWMQQTIFTDAIEQVKPMYRILHEDEARACKVARGVNKAGADCARLKVNPSNDPSSTSAVERPIDAEEQTPNDLAKEREEVKEQQRLLSQEKEIFDNDAELTEQQAR